MDLAAFQSHIEAIYGDRDRRRGTPGIVAWLCEEVGELARAARKGTPADQLEELADVLAWTVTLASQLGLSADEAIARYADGCPYCRAIPCACGG